MSKRGEKKREIEGEKQQQLLENESHCCPQQLLQGEERVWATISFGERRSCAQPPLPLFVPFPSFLSALMASYAYVLPPTHGDYSNNSRLHCVPRSFSSLLFCLKRSETERNKEGEGRRGKVGQRPLNVMKVIRNVLGAMAHAQLICTWPTCTEAEAVAKKEREGGSAAPLPHWKSA